jgi:hypothetical protein
VGVADQSHPKRETPTNGGWRLSAPEIEKAATSAVTRILKDHSAIGAFLDDAGFSAQELVRALKSIEEHRGRLEGERDSKAAVAIKRIDLKKDGLQMALDPAPLLADQLDNHHRAPLTITRFVPLQLKRRGVELRIAMEGEADSNRAIDSALPKAIARGYYWFNELASNRARDTREIASARACATVTSDA